MIRFFVLISFFLSFSSFSFASHHGGHGNDYVNNKHGLKFRFKEGESKKIKRYYAKPKPHFHILRKKLNRLESSKREAALKELERHINKMSQIIGNEKGFKEYRISKKHKKTVKGLNSSKVKKNQGNSSKKILKSESGSKKVTKPLSKPKPKPKPKPKTSSQDMPAIKDDSLLGKGSENKNPEQDNAKEGGASKQNSFQKIKRRVKFV